MNLGRVRASLQRYNYIGFNDDAVLDIVARWETPDDETFVITAPSSPQPTFIENLSSPPFRS